MVWKVQLSHNTVELCANDQEACCSVLLGKLRYLSHTEGAAVLAGAPDLTVPISVLAYKKASIENNDVCIGLWCLCWSVFELV